VTAVNERAIPQAGGWVKLWRSVTDSPVYTMPPIYLRVFERLILEANHADREIPYRQPGGTWTKRVIRRGSRLTSLRQISEWTGWFERGKWRTPNPKTIRDILNWLENQGMITLGEPSTDDGCKGLDLDSTFALCKQRGNELGNTRETLYTVVNYDLYQATGNNLGNKKETVTGSKQECKEPKEEEIPPSSMSRSGSGKGKTSGQYSRDFELWWQGYPRKVRKREAFACWKARLREGVTAETLTRARDAYVTECNRKGTPIDYIMHPATFLGKKRPFEDYLEVEPEGRDKPCLPTLSEQTKDWV
jgi:hypothetical protein